jgi:cell division protease FtsH
MAQIVLTALLMSFLLWSYKVLNKNFMPTAAPVAPATTSKYNIAFIKRLLLPILLFVGCYFFIGYALQEGRHEMIEEIRQDNFAQTSKIDEQEFINSFEQSKTQGQEKTKPIQVIQPNEIQTKFKDVAGLTEAKDEVQDIVRFLQDPDAFGRLGAKSPKGILLYGEPGTGKTLMARAIAGEAEVSFIAVAGSEFDEEFVGVGAARVRQLFTLARQNAPCIIFIDEIDALAHKRHAQDPAWSAQTVNQLLAEMDGLDNSKNAGIVVIGASNRINAIDPAVLRPGRLDRHIKLEIPTLSERVQVLDIYLRKVKVNSKVKAPDLAKMTSGFSSADLANLVNEAAILATKANKSSIEPIDFDKAKDRIILGSQRASLKITETTRKITAYHEAGHALVSQLLGESHQPLYKVTIAPRGQSLGHTSYEPKPDQVSVNLQELEARICTLLAGRIAEELIFGEKNITTGAEHDLKTATEIAYNMVTRWGYSKRVGLIYNHNNDMVPSDVIEQEVRAIIDKSYAQTKTMLMEQNALLNAFAKGLLEHETLDAAQIKLLMNGKPLNNPSSSSAR